MNRLFLVLALVAGSVFGAAPSYADKPDDDAPKKVFVCKYVGKPGVDEQLQTGGNPINVSVSAIPGGAAVGAYFGDDHDRSFVLAFDTGQAEPSVSECPAGRSLIPVATQAPSASPPTCSGDGALVLPSTAHVVYSSSPSGTGPGTYTVNAVAAADYVLTGTKQWTVEVLPRLSGSSDCPVDLIPVATQAPSASPPTCSGDGALVLPSTAHVVYSSSPSGTGPGTYTVSAVAAADYVLTGTKQWTVEVLPQLSGSSDCPVVLPPIPTESPTVTPATCLVDGILNLPTTEGVEYILIDFLRLLAAAGPGSHVVIAVPTGAASLTGETLWILEVPSRLEGEQCDVPDTTGLTICHRSNSNVKPYQLIGPSTAGVANGHDTQDEGPIWDPSLKSQKIEWGDIIPPYTYNNVDYPGQNWTTEGRLILRNDCAPGEVSAAAVPEVLTADTCDAFETPVPTVVEGIAYEFTTGDGVSGPWEITASALDNFEIPDDVPFVFSGDAGSGKDCVVPEVLIEDNCALGESPVPTLVEGVSYEFTEGDGVSGPWEITASALPDFVIADDVPSVFGGDAGLGNGCVVPEVLIEDNCAVGAVPVPTLVEGVSYQFTQGDGVSGPWEITASALPDFVIADDVPFVFTGDALDTDSCVSPGSLGEEPGVIGVFSPAVAAAPVVRATGLLPDTGGAGLWLLLIGGLLAASGSLLLRSSRRLVGSGSAAARHSLVLTGGTHSVTTTPTITATATGAVASRSRRADLPKWVVAMSGAIGAAFRGRRIHRH